MWEAWLALPVAQQVFSGMTLGFGGVLIGLLLLSLVGGGVHADADFDAHTDFDSSGFFSVKGILSFLTFFGGGAWLALRTGWPLWLALLVGLLCGYAVMSSLVYLLARLRALDASGNRRAEDLLGEEGTAYLPIPALGEGVGRIHLFQRGRLVEVEAVSSGAGIATGAAVRVVDVLGDHRVQVEPLDALPAGDAAPT